MSKNYSFCSLSVFTTIPDTQKPKTERKDHTDVKRGKPKQFIRVGKLAVKELGAEVEEEEDGGSQAPSPEQKEDPSAAALARQQK